MTSTTQFSATHAICLSINALIEDLNNNKIKPYPFSLKRRDLVTQGLMTLGKEADANVSVEPVGTAAGSTILFKADENGYGNALTALLNTIPVRHGEKPTKGFIIPQNSWGYIEQHHAEQMLFRAAGLAS